MAAETAAEIGANFSDYRGDVGLGSGGFGVIGIDVKPLENLGIYTTLYNKDKWTKEKNDTDARVKELADLSNISLNDLRTKDRDQATKEFSTLLQKATEYARKIPKNNQEKLENELQWQTEYGKFKNNFNSGKARAVTYAKRYSDIMGGTQDAKAKDAELSILNKEFDDTGIETPISATSKFKTSSLDIPPPIVQKMETISIGDNQDVQFEIGYYNPKTNSGSTDATILGIQKLYPKEGTSEYNLLSDAEKNQAKIQATVESGASVWVDATSPLNSVLKNYVGADGVFDATSFENDNASNTTLMNAYNALKNYDNYNRQKYEQGKSGVFSDKGLSVKLPENVNPDDFKVGFVDFAKGVNANQLVQSGRFAKYTGDTFTKKLTQTDNAIQRQRIAQDDRQLNETIRHNKAGEFLQGKELKNQEDKWKAAQTGGQTQVNGAMERAKRIYGDMVKLADSNGVITPDKLRQLNVEQLKYLGIEVPQERDPTTGTIISAGGFKPLDLSSPDPKKPSNYVIQLVDGQIKVLKDAKHEGNGVYTGQFDNTKSTTLYNIGTNILNEELKNSGSKELNAYFGVDVTNGITSNTDGGSTTVSGTTQSSSTTPTQSRKGKDGKTYTSTDGITWTASDGTTVKLKQ